MKYLYRVYQLCVALPLIAVLTVLTAVTVIIGCHVVVVVVHCPHLASSG